MRAFSDLHTRPIDIVEQLNWRGKPVQREVRAERPIDVLSRPLRPQHNAGGASADAVARAVRMIGSLDASLTRVAAHEGELNSAVDDAVAGVRSLGLHADSEGRAIARLERFRPEGLVSQPDRGNPRYLLERLVDNEIEHVLTRPRNSLLEQAGELSDRAERSLEGSLNAAPLEPWTGHDLFALKERNGYAYATHAELDKLDDVLSSGIRYGDDPAQRDGRLVGSARDYVTSRDPNRKYHSDFEIPEPILDARMRLVSSTVDRLDELLTSTHLESMVHELQSVDRSVNDVIAAKHATTARLGHEIDDAAAAAREAYGAVFGTR